MKGRAILIGVLALLLAASYAVAGPPVDRGKDSAEITLAGTVASKISYQGRLTDAGGNPLDGNYNLVFQLWDDATAGSQLGSDIAKNNVPVSNGLFTVDLDIPQDAFNGQALWLQINVNGQVLSPRQELLPVPYAFYALGAPWSGLTDVPPGFADGVDDTGSAGPHDHWGETWSGSGVGLTLNSSNEDGLRVSGGDDGIQVESASDDGVFVKSAGQDGVLVDSPGRDGVSVVDPGSDGFYVNNAGDDGLGVVSAADNGVQIDYAGNDGVYIDSAANDGVHVESAGNDGVYGRSTSPDGRGVVGVASAESGLTHGVHGESASANGYGGYFTNTGGGKGLFVKGDAAQSWDGYGFARAAVYAYCSQPIEVYRWFNIVNGWLAASSPGEGGCYFDFDFNLTDRFWVASPAGGALYESAGCQLRPGYTRQLYCWSDDDDGDPGNGRIMVIVY